MKSQRTKATDIPPQVKKAVEERDSIDGVLCCIFCKTPYNVHGECHVIARSQGGLGVEQNLVSACRKCHSLMDNSIYRDYYINKAKEYLKSIYPDWNEESLIYNKWKGFKYQ